MVHWMIGAVGRTCGHVRVDDCKCEMRQDRIEILLGRKYTSEIFIAYITYIAYTVQHMGLYVVEREASNLHF